MIVVFHSKTSSNVTMLEDGARRVLAVMNKTLEDGRVGAAEIPAAIAALEELGAHPGSVGSQIKVDVDAHHDDHLHESHDGVSLAARAYPLLSMLRESAASGAEVTWELRSRA